MEKYYWAPTREDRIGVSMGIFKEDGVSRGEVEQIVDTFPGQSIDFFGALRARVYDDKVRDFVKEIGTENIGKRLVNSREGKVSFCFPCIYALLPDVSVVALAMCGALSFERDLVAAATQNPILRCPNVKQCLSCPCCVILPCMSQHNAFGRACRDVSFTLQIAFQKSAVPVDVMLQVEFEKPAMTVDALIKYGRMLVDEQENVSRVQLAEAYLSGAELAGLDGSSMPPELVKKIEERKEEDDRQQAQGPKGGLLS